MEEKSKSPDNESRSSKSISSHETRIPLAKVSEILDIPEEELEKLELPEFFLKKITEIYIKQSYFAGPLPPPSVVSEYEKIFPGSFNRIIKMTEQNAQHRMKIDKHEIEMEKVLVPESIKIKRAGQNKAFFISIIGIIAVVVCAYLGETTIGSILAGTTLISLVPNFIAGIKKEKETRAKGNEGSSGE